MLATPKLTPWEGKDHSVRHSGGLYSDDDQFSEYLDELVLPAIP